MTTDNPHFKLPYIKVINTKQAEPKIYILFINGFHPFAICLHKKDQALLESIKAFFNETGNITKLGVSSYLSQRFNEYYYSTF